MKLDKNKTLLFAGTLGIVMAILLNSCSSDSSLMFNSVSSYEKAREIRAFQKQIADYNLCITDRDGAKLKLISHYKGNTIVKAPKVYELTSKTFVSCHNPVTKEIETVDDGEPNFIRAGGGIASFLQLNAPSYVVGSEDAFLRVGEHYGIEPSLLVCIAQADSSLGHNTKTQNNIGNVGNNDRGDTVSYATLEAGIEAIGQVLTNQYLGGYTMIGELSRGGGNSGSPVYATSPYNWNKNVKLCLQDILQTDVNESFIFRTKQ